jgi:hypothetical protein
MRGVEADAGAGAAAGAARRGNVESQNLAMLRMGRRLTRHPQMGAVCILLGAHWLPLQTKQLQDGGN